MVCQLLALHFTINVTPPEKTALELLDASLQDLGSIAFSSQKALGLITQAWRQVWLAQSKLSEACRREVLTTDASLTGWGGLWKHQGIRGS